MNHKRKHKRFHSSCGLCKPFKKFGGNRKMRWTGKKDMMSISEQAIEEYGEVFVKLSKE